MQDQNGVWDIQGGQIPNVTVLTKSMMHIPIASLLGLPKEHHVVGVEMLAINA